MKHIFFFILFFFLEIGRQNDYMYIGNGAPFAGPHWWKTRVGVGTAYIYARLSCRIKFSKP